MRATRIGLWARTTVPAAQRASVISSRSPLSASHFSSHTRSTTPAAAASVVVLNTRDITLRRSYRLPHKDLTPHEQLVKWYDYYECLGGYTMCANKLSKILKLAEEVDDPIWTTRKRVASLVGRCRNGTVYSYNSIVSFLHSHGWIDEAFSIFTLMKNEGVLPTLMSFHALLNCYIARQDFPNAGMVLEDIRKAGLKPTIVSYATLFKGLIDHGNTLPAVKMFIEDMQRNNIKPEFVADVERLLAANDGPGISNLCADVIHEHLSAEEKEEEERNKSELEHRNAPIANVTGEPEAPVRE